MNDEHVKDGNKEGVRGEGAGGWGGGGGEGGGGGKGRTLRIFFLLFKKYGSISPKIVGKKKCQNPFSAMWPGHYSGETFFVASLRC